MKTKFFLAVGTAILALLTFSCEEPFTPKTPFVPRPFVVCIIAAHQWGGNYYMPVTATVATTYDVAGLDPMANTVDPFDTNAAVIVRAGPISDSLGLLKFKRSDSIRYRTKDHLFYDHGQFHTYGLYTLSVRTGKGEKLSASTTVPPARVIESSYQFAAGVSAWTTDPKWTFSWDNDQKNDHLYFPKLEVAYQVILPDTTMNRTVEIPLTYVQKEGKQVPVYPSFTRDFSITYDFWALTPALASISEGDMVKSHYKIGFITFTLVEYDVNLSNFYASTHGYLDAYSVRVDESTYTNISGGLGVFGSSFLNSWPFEMKLNYIRSFGYQM